MIITRKIELWITESDKEKKNQAWSFLRGLDNDVYKAYNLVISNQYLNEAFTERIRKTDIELVNKDEEIEKQLLAIEEEYKKCDDKEKKVKLTDQRKKLFKAQGMLTKEARAKAEQMYLTSEQNSTYQLLGQKFPNIPSSIRTCINVGASNDYKNDAFDVKMGRRSIRSYRKGIPMPFQKTAMRFSKNKEGDIMMNWLGGVSFKLHFGKDKSNNEVIIKRAMEGEYKYSDSKIQIDGKKIFLLFCVDIPEDKRDLDPNLSVGVNLGIVVPAYCALSEGLQRLAIGDINDFFRVRRQMQERRTRLQTHLRLANGGRGREDKLKALDKIKQNERNFARTYNHNVSSQIIKFALNHGAGVIKMELLEGYGDKEKDSIVLRNWSYFELHTMVEYKAKKYGILVQYTDPHLISQTCNVCEKYHEDNLETRSYFVCKNEECKEYKVKIFSDYNAALNNAKSLRIVEKKEDCQVHKNMMAERVA